MKYLEDLIKEKGRVIDGRVLKIDSFLNHQIDPKVIEKIGEEFYRLYKDKPVNKILTVESSGISMAFETSKHFNYCPVVFAKKVPANSQAQDVYKAELFSYTREKTYTITVVKDYLKESDNVLIIDDFLAMGQALKAMIELVRQSGSTLVGCGICVEKAFQPGGKELRDKGIRIDSLARVKAMSNKKIEFVEE